ncbi:MAG: hypothetical protein NWQ54_04780 [Paraglaciecola sp.]|nr:hypothetical protein [Paraglaciecola sp.]
MITNQQSDFLLELSVDKSDIPSYLDFFVFIDAPEHLKYLGAVLENVKYALSRPFLKDINQLFASGHLTNEEVDRYRFQCDYLIKAIENIKDADHYKRPQNTNVKEIMHGILTTHPYYVILFMNAKDNQSLYCTFHQIILFFVTLVKAKQCADKRIELKGYEKIKLSEAFRKFSTDTFINEWYKDVMSEQFHSLDDFINQFETLLKRLKSADTDSLKSVMKSCESFIEILNLARGIPKARKNFSKSKSRKNKKSKPSDITGYSALRGEMLVALTLPDNRDEQDVVLSFSMIMENDYQNEALDSGEEEAEQESKETFIFQTSQPLIAYARAYIGKRTAKSFIAIIERQNNYLPSSLQRLSAFETQHVFLTLNQDPENANQLVKQLVVLVMFFTSCDFQRAIAAINQSKKNILSDNNLNFRFCHQTKYWVMPAYKPSYQTPFDEEIAPPNIKSFYLSTTSLCKKKFNMLRNSDFTSGDIHNEINNLTESDIRKYIETFNINGLNLSRIKNHLFQTCCSLFGQATATLIFFREALGSNARSFYTTLTVEMIQQRYAALLTNTINSIDATNNIELPQNPLPGLVGARYKPEMLNVKQSLLNMREKLKDFENKLTERGVWLDFHNLYVCYQILAQSLLTGMRPIKSPLLHRENLLFSNGIYVRKEKNHEDQFSIRHIPVCDTTLALNDAFDSHMLAVKGRLIRKNLQPAVFDKLFFLTEEGNPAASTIKMYKKTLGTFFKSPPNFNRKLLRNFLEEHELSHEIIDVALGHANLGEQYWADHSSLSMREVRQYLYPYMEKFRKDLGITVIQGLKA